MTRHRQLGATLALTALLVSSLAAAITILTRIDRIRREVRRQEILYIPSPAAIRRMSLGYTGLAADIYWTRAVQYFGRKHFAGEMDYRLLYPLLDITTSLDPQLVVAYRFGGIFLAQRPPAGAGQPDKAVELLERGIKANPDDWRLYFDLGFIHTIERRDYAAAAQTFERGSRVPQAHPSLKILAAVAAQHGGDPRLARHLWEITLETAATKEVRSNAIQHLRALQVDEDVAALEQIVAAYRQRHGRLPSSFDDLIRASLLSGLPIDPLGHSYKLAREGRVQVQEVDALPFITKGIPPGATPKADALVRFSH